MSNKNDIFSFDLNESLYFEKGHEVSEMLGISLEPEISIQSFQDYVSIRGVIELQGEYLKSTIENEREEGALDIYENQSLRYLEKIEHKDGNHAVFSHRFPVEISVPSYRVTNLDDITVNIETFDYELPAENQLILSSTIEIFGISNQDQEKERTNGENNESQHLEPTIDEDGLFEFDLKKEVSGEDLRAVEPKDLKDEPIVPPIQEEIANDTGEDDTESTDVDERLKYKKTHTIEEFLKDVDVQSKEVIKAEEKVGSDDVITVINEKNEPSEKDISHQEEDIKSDEVREVDYLKDLFGGGEAEEVYAQMRICIVQESDTLETISERYEIPKMQLLKQNQLEDERLSEGQLLSISFKDKEQE